MKFIHLSDLHIGKRVNEYSMIEDQQYILTQIINIIDEVKPAGVIIAGDVYDKPIPSAEAVELFDNFLCKLAERNLRTFVISGNHDSPERIAFASRLIDKSGIHLSPVYNGTVTPVTLTDEYGDIDIYMLPFIKPAHVRRFYPDEEISNYTDAMKVAIDNMPLDKAKRNLIITHQFVTGSERCESEELSVGGADNVDAAVFKDFDYVALGHIHGPQNCTSERIRYCGTPLKYSFSEANHKKSVTVVELPEKGNLKVDTIPLTPLRDMKEIKGTYDEIIERDFYEGTSYTKDYMHITLTDEEDIYDAIGRLRIVYKNLMKLDYDNKRTRGNASITQPADVKRKTHFELFADFYEDRNSQPMSDEQAEFVKELIESIWEEKL